MREIKMLVTCGPRERSRPRGPWNVWDGKDRFLCTCGTEPRARLITAALNEQGQVKKLKKEKEFLMGLTQIRSQSELTKRMEPEK